MKALGKIALSTTLLVAFLSPSFASASTLVQSLTPNTTILDSGDVRCIGKLGTENNKTQINISCSSSLYKTNLRITKIEIYNPVITSAEISVTAKGFSVTSAGDYVPSNTTKIYSVGVNLPASYSDSYTPMISIYPVSYFPQKIYIEGESGEFVINLKPTEVYGTNAITQFNQVEPLTLYLLGESMSTPVVMSDSDCLSQDMHSISSGGNSCVCAQNYAKNVNNKCVSQAEACISFHGSKSLPTGDGICGCMYGYYLNGNSQCVENVKPTPTSIPNVQIPTVATVTPPVIASKLTTSISAPKPHGTTNTPGTTWTVKQIGIRGTTTATTTDIQGATSTIEITKPLASDKIIEPDPLKPKSFWSRVISWLKFW